MKHRLRLQCLEDGGSGVYITACVHQLLNRKVPTRTVEYNDLMRERGIFYQSKKQRPTRCSEEISVKYGATTVGSTGIQNKV